MAEGKVPEQESIDAIRREARLETLCALRDLEVCVRADEGMGGVDAIMLGVLWQQASEKVRVYRMTVNLGEEPTHRSHLAELEDLARGLRRRRPF